MFKYVYHTRFSEISVIINHHTRSLKFLPFKETIRRGDVKGFEYNNKIRSHVLRYKDGKTIRLEVLRNASLESELLKVSLRCKTV